MSCLHNYRQFGLFFIYTSSNCEHDMKQSRRHAVDRVTEYIRKSIADGSLVPGRRIPSSSEIAAELSVSERTVWRASKTLQQEGVLRRRSRNILEVGETSWAPRQEAQNAVTTSGWEAVRARIERDIITGVYSPYNTLPSRKELQSQYNVNSRTLSKIINALCKENVLISEGRSLRINIPTRSDRVRRLVLFCPMSESGVIQLSPHDELFVRMIEALSARFGIVLETLTYFHREDVLTRDQKRHGLRIPYGDDVLGYVYIVNSETCVVEDLLTDIHSFRKRIAIVDEVSGVSYPSLLENSPYVHFFPMVSSYPAGKMVGRYLLGLGHRRVSYVSILPWAWSKARLAGLKEAFASAGLPDAVTTIENFPESPSYAPDPLLRAYNEWRKNAPQTHAEEFDAVFKRMPVYTVRRAERKFRAYHAFSGALRDPKVTAWVCAFDGIGIQALDFLKTHNIPVPRRVSVIAFDDSVEALSRGLTSYNFNVEGYAHAVFNYFAFPNLFHTSSKTRVTELSGLVVERRSVKKT